jgi:heptosyltransferase-2
MSARRVHALPVPEGGFRRIAVLRLSSLGDVILALPVVEALAAAWPAAALEFWVKEEYAGVLRAHPALKHVRALERDARKLEDLVSMSAELEDCDLIVDLHGSMRTRVLTFRQRAPVLRVRSRRLQRARWVHARWTRPRPLPHAIERYGEALARLGLTPAGTPLVTLSEADEAWGRNEAWAFAGERPRVVLCPGARHATKCWPEARWVELDERLEQAGVARLVVATASERAERPALVARVERASHAAWLTGSLERAAAAIGAAPVAVTHDSGLMHLAVARGLRVVALFGSTSPVLGFAPAGAGHAVLCRNLSCQPCTLHGRDRCPLGHHACMTGIGVDEVLAEVMARSAGGTQPLRGEPSG